MALPDDGLRAVLKSRGWHQGSVLAAADLPALVGRVARAAPGCNWPHEPVMVVLTQTCDLIHDKLATEPIVDLVVGEVVNAPDKQKARNQNSRELDITATKGGTAVTLRLHMRMRVFLPRDALLDKHPCPITQVSTEGVDLLARWMRDRFARTALPDTFDTRVSDNKKAWKKLAQELEAATDISDLFIALSPQGEANADQQYECGLLATMSHDSYSDAAKRQRAITTLQTVKQILNGCPGIEVVDDEVAPEAEVTVEDLRRYKRFNFEYLSLDRRDDHDIPDVDMVLI